ncbi:MAG: HEPN domain-containing protein [Crenarchaeota archaeon]|nr:HEPN domain-containing protein [Thermoproteota archaeon]
MEAARATLSSAEADAERGDYNWACFKAQQAAELAVKGLLRGLGQPRYGHSVARLLLEAARLLSVEPPSDVIDCGKLLDKLYIPTRYPDAWSEGPPHFYFTRRDAAEAIECARRVLAWVEEQWSRLRLGDGGSRGSG